jgi:hypothetical protein
MVANDDKATNSNCFHMHLIFEQKYPKPAIVQCVKLPLVFQLDVRSYLIGTVFGMGWLRG